MATQPELSIIIVNWKSVEFLRACLATVYRTTRTAGFEVVVVDNASDDGCGDMLAAEFPAVRFIQSRENLGFGRANNLGALGSSGRYLLFLNPDTEVSEGALGRMVKALEETPRAAIAGPRLLNSDGTVQTSCVRAFPTIAGELLDSDFLRRRFPRARWWGAGALLDARRDPVPVDAVSGAALMIRREAFLAVHGFTTAYFMYAEDMDLCFKTAQAGWPCLYVPEAVIVHHGGQSSQARDEGCFADVVLRESRLLFFRARRGAWYAACYRATTALAALGRMVLLAPMAGRSFWKWAHILRWSVGMEAWARRLPRAGSDA